MSQIGKIAGVPHCISVIDGNGPTEFPREMNSCVCYHWCGHRNLSPSEFYFTGDDYRYRFEVEAKQRFIDLIRERFNVGVACRDRVLKWDTIIELKANELGRFLVGKSLRPDFAEPAPRLERNDERGMRARILALTSSQAKRLGLEKSTLHYLRLHAKRQRFEVYGKTRERLEVYLP